MASRPRTLGARTAVIDLRLLRRRRRVDGSGRFWRPRLQVERADAIQRVRRLIACRTAERSNKRQASRSRKRAPPPPPWGGAHQKPGPPDNSELIYAGPYAHVTSRKYFTPGHTQNRIPLYLSLLEKRCAKLGTEESPAYQGRSGLSPRDGHHTTWRRILAQDNVIKMAQLAEIWAPMHTGREGRRFGLIRPCFSRR